MYIRDKMVRAIKIKNMILAVIGFFDIAASVYVLVSLLAYYREQPEIVLEAKAFPECIVASLIGTVLRLFRIFI